MTYSTSVHSLDFNIHNASIQFKEYDGDDIKVEAKNIFKSFTINENDWKIVIHQPQTLGISHNNTADIIKISIFFILLSFFLIIENYSKKSLSLQDCINML